jgi:hypothetical protein
LLGPPRHPGLGLGLVPAGHIPPRHTNDSPLHDGESSIQKVYTFQYIYPSIHAFVHEIKAEIRCTSVLPSTSADSKTSGIDVKISIGFKHQLTMYKQIVQFYR